MTTKKPDIRLVAIAVVAIVVGGMFSIAMLSMIPTGWEVQTSNDHLYVNDERYDVGLSAATSSRLTTGVIGAKESSFKIADGIDDNAVWPDMVKYTGTTGLHINMGNPLEVSWNSISQEWDAAAVDAPPFQVYQKPVGETVYFYNHRVYQTDILIETEGQSIRKYVVINWVLGVPEWDYVWYGTCDGLPHWGSYYESDVDADDIHDTPIAAYEDHQADFRLKFIFALTPWAIAVGDVLDGVNETQWEVTDEFMGVASATVMAVYPGRTAYGPAPDEIDYAGHAKAITQPGAALNMYDLDGATLQDHYAEVMSGDVESLGTIDRLPSEVMFELMGQLEPGSDYVGGSVDPTAVNPAQYQVMWQVRIDVVTGLGVNLIAGQQPTVTTNATGVEDPDKPPGMFPWVDDFLAYWNEVLEDVGSWLSSPMNILFLMIVVAVIGFVLFLVFGGGGLLKGAGTMAGKVKAMPYPKNWRSHR